MAFHVMNRSANRLPLFSTCADYEAFMAVMVEAGERIPVRLLTYAVMPNHWHFVIWSRKEGDISQHLQWLTGTHAQRWRAAHDSRGAGAVYQGRFRWVPVQHDLHLLRACRYVERNPLRAGLVSRAERWPWSSRASADCRTCQHPEVSAWPISKPDDWLEFVNEGEPPLELASIRECIARSLPYGTSEWRGSVAGALQIPLAGRGRPRKTGNGEPVSAKNLPTPFPPY